MGIPPGINRSPDAAFALTSSLEYICFAFRILNPPPTNRPNNNTIIKNLLYQRFFISHVLLLKKQMQNASVLVCDILFFSLWYYFVRSANSFISAALCITVSVIFAPPRILASSSISCSLLNRKILLFVTPSSTCFSIA